VPAHAPPAKSRTRITCFANFMTFSLISFRYPIDRLIVRLVLGSIKAYPNRAKRVSPDRYEQNSMVPKEPSFPIPLGVQANLYVSNIVVSLQILHEQERTNVLNAPDWAACFLIHAHVRKSVPEGKRSGVAGERGFVCANVGRVRCHSLSMVCL